jgi:hypothetical protein
MRIAPAITLSPEQRAALLGNFATWPIVEAPPGPDAVRLAAGMTHQAIRPSRDGGP